MRIDDPDTNQTRANLRKPRQNEDGTWRYVLSDESMDSYSSRILVKGWSLKRFLSNPVVPWAHNYDIPPVGRAVRVWKSVEGKGPALLMDVQFMKAEDYGDDWPAGIPSPVAIEAMTRSGYLRGSSVGMRPLDWEFMRAPGSDGKPDPRGEVIGIEYRKAELLEGSIVPIPANANALARCLHEGHMTLSHLPEVFRAVDIAETVDEDMAGMLRREMDSPRLFAVGGLQPPPPSVTLDPTTQNLLDEVRNVGGLARSLAGLPGSPVDAAELAEPLAEALRRLTMALRPQEAAATGEPHDRTEPPGDRAE